MSAICEDLNMDALDARWGRPLETIVASLYYLELGCTDPAASAEFYRRAMEYVPEPQGDAIVCRAEDRRLVFVPGAPKTLVSAGFALPDVEELDRLRARIERAGHPFEEGATRLFERAILVRDPDGNQYALGLPHSAPAQETGTTALAARLQHVVMASQQPHRIVQFFIDVLGFTLSDDVLDEEGGVRTSFLRCSQEHHSFAVFLAPENRLDHHCYETVDWNMIRDWCDHMAEEHVRIEWGPGRHGPGNNLFMFIHDPDGNWVELSAELDIVAHDRPIGKWVHEQRTLNSWGQGLLRS